MHIIVFAFSVMNSHARIIGITGITVQPENLLVNKNIYLICWITDPDVHIMSTFIRAQ